MLVLGIESSCDETAAAVVNDGKMLSNVIASQIKDHSAYGGVVPEIASRKHIEAINPVLQQALADADVTLKEIEGIAVTRGPGLIGSLLDRFIHGQSSGLCPEYSLCRRQSSGRTYRGIISGRKNSGNFLLSRWLFPAVIPMFIWLKIITIFNCLARRGMMPPAKLLIRRPNCLIWAIREVW